MGLIAYRFRATFRRRWRTYLGIAVLLGVTGGLSLTAVAGARRTQSALPRFLDAANSSTMSANTGPYDPDLEASIAALPQARRSSADLAFNVAPLVDGELGLDEELNALASLDGRYLRQDRFTPTQGRSPDPRRIDEVAFNELAAERSGHRVGQRIELATYADEQLEDPDFFAHPTPPVLRMTATIVGIGLFPDEVIQDEADLAPRLLLSQAYAEQAVAYASYSWQGLVLAGGDADVEAVEQHYLDLSPEGAAKFRVTSVDEFHGLQAVRPLSLALGVFGVIAGVASLVLVGQALTRAIRSERGERAVLRAIGATPGASAGAALVGPLLAILAGTALAVVTAVAASPAMPIGPVRRVEVAKGVDVDLTVLGLGALGIMAILSVLSAVVAWRESPHRVEVRQGATARSSRVSAVATATGLGPAAVFGLRSALEPERSATAVPVRSVMAGAVVSVIALVGAVTFGASLDALLAEPRLYGWDWDATIVDTAGYGDISLDKASAVLDPDPRVAAWSGTWFASDSLDGKTVPLLAIEPGGDVLPPLIEGRPTRSTDEIVLGSATADELGKHVDDTVVLGGLAQPRQLTVVGIATFPTVGALFAAHASLGVGAVVAPEVVYRVNTGPQALLVRFRPGTDQAAAMAHLAETTGSIGEFPGGSEVLAAQRPAEIVNAGDIGAAPKLLAGLLALGALGSLALALGTSVRRRRRELALLKALGFSRRQISATVAWQASATVAIGLVLGVPLGVVLGRQLWNVFARQLDVVPQPSVPLLALLGLTAAGVVVANAVAAIPARSARRIPASALLRSE